MEYSIPKVPLRQIYVMSFVMHPGEQNQILLFQFPMLRPFKKYIPFSTLISDSTQHLFMAQIKYSKVRLHHNPNDTTVNLQLLLLWRRVSSLSWY